MDKKVTDKEITAGWKKAAETYQPGELLPAEAEAFERASLEHQASKEYDFCLPPCKDFPNCDCARHNAMVRRKYGLD